MQYQPILALPSATRVRTGERSVALEGLCGSGGLALRNPNQILIVEADCRRCTIERSL